MMPREGLEVLGRFRELAVSLEANVGLRRAVARLG
jgi:hypothetical protein